MESILCSLRLCICVPYTADESIVNRVKEQLTCKTIHDAAAKSNEKLIINVKSVKSDSPDYNIN